MKIYLILFFLFSCGHSSKTLEDDKPQLDDYFDLIETKDKGMGAILITEGDIEKYSRAYGYSNVEMKIKNTLDTPFHIGSISKTLTAVIILRLVEEKKLSLDYHVDRFFPKFKHSKKITIKDLLKQQTGIENFTDLKDYNEYKNKMLHRDQVLEKFYKLKSNFRPGLKHEYSNTNYVLLSFIAEMASKKSFAELIEFYLARPLNLKNTFLYHRDHKRKEEALSYTFRETWIPSEMTAESIPLGAGAIASSPRDLTKIFKALFRDELLSKELFTEMTDMKDQYGYGLFEIPFYEEKALGHTGGIDAYRSLAMCFKKNETCYVHLTNATELAFNDMNIAALSLYFKKDFKMPEFKSFDLTGVDLKKYEGIYADKKFPMKIKIFEKDKKLYAQATGQDAFALHPIEEHCFEYASASIQMQFDPEKGKMTFTQGQQFILTRE